MNAKIAIVGGLVFGVFVLLFVLVLGGAGAFWFNRPAVATSTVDQRPREELVIDLPEDGGSWSLTVVYQTDDHSSAEDRRLRAAFWSEPRLRSLVAQTNFNAYKPSDPLWTNKFREAMGDALPQLWLQDDHGHVLYKVSGDNVPSHPTTLADELQASIQEATPVSQLFQPRGQQQVPPHLQTPNPTNYPNRPDPNVRPKPNPHVPAVNPLSRIPDIRPQFLRPDSHVPLVGWVLGGIVVLIVCVVLTVVVAALVAMLFVPTDRP